MARITYHLLVQLVLMICANMSSHIFLTLVISSILCKFVYGRTLDEQFEMLSRDKRYLTYTYGSAIGMFLAFAVPLELPDRDVLFSYNFEANYNLPTNISQYDLTPPDRSFFYSINRTYIYQILEGRLNNFGLKGEECLLRTICEASRYPLHQNGIIGYLLHVLFTPSSSEDENLAKEEEAEDRGRNHNDECVKYYNCPVDILDYISHFSD